MKKILFTLVLFLVPSIILANEISNIDMNIYVDNNGTAHVTEEWTTNLIQGTEGYKRRKSAVYDNELQSACRKTGDKRKSSVLCKGLKFENIAIYCFIPQPLTPSPKGKGK